MNDNSGWFAATVEKFSVFRFRIETWTVLGCVVLAGILIELVRRHRLKERYSFLWFITISVLLMFTLRRAWLEELAHLVGVYYPPTALFLLLVFFMLLILIHYSTVISELLTDIQVLVQSLGILEARVRQLERTSEPAQNPSDPTTDRTSELTTAPHKKEPFL